MTHRSTLAFFLAGLIPTTAAATIVHNTVNLPVAPGPAQIRVVDESAMLHDLNVSRRAAHLRPLLLDGTLRRIARAFAVDMVERGYFGHASPEGETEVDRLRAAAYRYRWAGENIAFDSDEHHAEQALFASPGHHRNIMNPHYTRVGIGAYATDSEGVVYVQEFASR